MSAFTCITCRVAFNEGDTQRLHYGTDWHRYNLKRKVAELPPVSAEEFQHRVLTQKAADTAATTGVYCNACQKSFSNEKAYNNHLNSKKHKTNERCLTDTVEVGSQSSKQSKAEQDDDDDVSEVDSDEWDEDGEEVSCNDCLFCLHHSRNVVKNVKHMTSEHSFFVPDVEFCVDLNGLIQYLGEKITQGYMCLWCNEKGKSFHSADAARKHMLDKGHCKMIHEGIALAEYANFYDYSASYPDHEDDIDKDEEIDVPEIEGNDYQLVLPSGAVVGHRSLMRYYKQSLDPNRVVAVSTNNRKLHKVLAHYKTLGWTTTQQESAARKARDIHYMKRHQSKLQMKLSLKANKFQTHYRPQVNF